MKESKTGKRIETPNGWIEYPASVPVARNKDGEPVFGMTQEEYDEFMLTAIPYTGPQPISHPPSNLSFWDRLLDGISQVRW